MASSRLIHADRSTATRLRRIGCALIALVVLGAQASLSSVAAAAGTTPTGLTLSALSARPSTLYVLNGGSQILKIELQRQAPVVVAATVFASGLDDATGLAADGLGNVYVAEPTTHRVLKYAPSGGSPTTVETGLLEPTAVAADGSGNIFVVGNTDNRAVEVPAGGGPPNTLTSDLQNPVDIAVSSVGDVYISDFSNGRTIKLPVGGGPAITLNAGGGTPGGVAVGRDGLAYVLDPSNSRLALVDQAGDFVTNVGGPLVVPTDVAVDDQNAVFIADAGLSRVAYTDAEGDQSYITSAETDGLLTNPLGVATTPTTPTIPYNVSVAVAAYVVASPAGSPPTGNVILSENGVDVGTIDLVGSGSFSQGQTSTSLDVGNHQLTGRYLGDADHAPSAIEFPVDVVVTPGRQELEFHSTAPTTSVVGSHYNVLATALISGLDVSVSIDPSSTPGACTLSGTTVTFTGVGRCIIDADQPGTSNWAAAPQVQQILQIASASTTTPTSTPGSARPTPTPTSTAAGAPSGSGDELAATGNNPAAPLGIALLIVLVGATLTWRTKAARSR